MGLKTDTTHLCLFSYTTGRPCNATVLGASQETTLIKVPNTLQNLFTLTTSLNKLIRFPLTTFEIDGPQHIFLLTPLKHVHHETMLVLNNTSECG